MNWKEYCLAKHVAPKDLLELAQTLKSRGQTIATLNGAFDLLHPGHLYTIFEAAKCADVLIVLLNVDSTIKANKGASRPFCPLEQRLLMMAGIYEVGYVSWFEESDPRQVLSQILPDVHVNGQEYGPDCIEAEVVRRGGGRIHLVDRIGGYATSKTAERILTCV